MRCALLAQLLGVSAWLVSHEPERQLSGARVLAESDSTTSRAAAPWSVLRGKASAFQPPPPRSSRAVGRSARAPIVRASDDVDEKESVFGIDLTENFKSKKEKSALDDEKTAGEEEEDPLAWRYPEYPEGMHDAGKADRRGPFWSSLGEPDVSTGPRPNYLRRDDWHISSTYTNEQREAIAKEEAEVKAVMEEKRREGEIAAAALEGTVEESMSDEEFFAPSEYMRLEPGPPHTGPLPPPSKYPMPNTWQAYQALQEKVFLLGEDEEALREEAAGHEAALRDFYQTFKDIVGNGWKIQNNPQVEAAMEFILKNRPSEAEEEWIKIAGGEDARFS